MDETYGIRMASTATIYDINPNEIENLKSNVELE